MEGKNIPFCTLSTGVLFAIGFTGFLTMIGALLGLMYGRNKSWSSQVFAVFAGSASLFLLSLIFAPYMASIFGCSCSVAG
jgi:hypothetical protein